MDLPSAKVIETLEAKGLTEIHHANSVLTSTQFLRHASLLSRGTIERRGYFQTEQSSDKLDKKYSLWFDVFTDSVDIHDRAGTANLYGPVLFVLGLEQLKKMYKGRLWVTKVNPTKWEGKQDDVRWFRSIEELEAGFTVGTFDQMIVFRHSGGEVPIKPCLTKLILDDPELIVPVEKEADVYSMAYGALRVSMKEGGINVPVERRVCRDGCKCRKKYEDSDFASKMFLPYTT
jgi:hypothetical protein